MRIYATFAMGEAPISTLIGAIFEIAMLGFIPWHRHIFYVALLARTPKGH